MSATDFPIEANEGRGQQFGGGNTQNNYFLSQALAGRKPRPFLAPPRPRYSLVGREEIARQVKDHLLSGCGVALLTLPGVGKTALATALAYDAEIAEHFGNVVLWATLGLRPEPLRALGQWLAGMGVSAEQIERLPTAEQRRAALAERIGDMRVLVIVDDVWDAEAAQALTLPGPNCVHLYTTRGLEIADTLAGETAVMVPELSERDAVALLAKHAPSVVQSMPEAARDLVREVGCLPLAIVILGRYLTEESVGGVPDLIRSTLERLRTVKEMLSLSAARFDARYPTLAAAAQMTYDVLSEPAKQALQELSIFRPYPFRFTLQAARAVCDPASERTSAQFAGVMRELRNRGLLEASQGEFSLHRSIAAFAAVMLPDSREEELHAHAEAHYRKELRAYDERDRAATSYLQCYRYEAQDWQDAASSWLYHLAQMQDRTQAGAALTTLYLDAFWWWGCYVPFPFCDRLLREWEATQRRPQDRVWLMQLRRFSEAYPRGASKPPDARRWEDVETALNAMYDMADLDREPNELAPDRRHLRALIDIFLAESYRFRDRMDRRADQQYADALRLFAHEGHAGRWNLGWVHYHMADLARERERPDDALAACAKALRVSRIERDYENIANVLRVQADIAWLQGDRTLAFDRYAQAASYAFLFLVEPEPPDFYTISFYAEIRERIGERVGQVLEACGPPEALACVAQLHAFWTPYWSRASCAVARDRVPGLLAAGQIEELLPYLMPPPPDEADPCRPDSLYVERARATARELMHAVSAQPAPAEGDETT